MAKHIRHLASLKRLAKRLLRLRKRHKLILITFLVVNLCLLSQLYANIWVYPKTFLGRENVSGKTAWDIEKRVDMLSRLSYHMQVKNRSYTYTLGDLGVIIDKDHIKSLLFAPNTRPFPFNAMDLVKSVFVRRTIDIPLVFTQDFNEFIQRSLFDFSDTPGDTVLFDSTEKTLVYMENEEKYLIDESYLKTLLTDRVGNNTLPLYPKLTKLQNERAETVADTGGHIKDIFLNPLTVYVDASGNVKTFILTEKELAQIANVQLSADQMSVAVGIHDSVASQIFNDHVRKLGFLTKDTVMTPKVSDDITRVVTARFAGHSVDGLTLSLDKGPNTTGTQYEKYIEVDISQQQMYLFKNGKLVKTYRVSTGLEYPTPTGEFKILNKAGLGYSNIYNVWMPYWMGFSYSEKLHAFFGIHELPYTLVGDQKVKRPGDYIGKPNTGGCVALDVGAAREVYQFADIGTPVIIFR
jgi:hypothetical protein